MNVRTCIVVSLMNLFILVLYIKWVEICNLFGNYIPLRDSTKRCQIFMYVDQFGDELDKQLKQEKPKLYSVA